MANIVGTADPDILDGTTSDDMIQGLGGDDILRGLAGNDALYGGDGDDILIGGPGDDGLVGGAGIDTADYSASSNPIQIYLWMETGRFGDAGFSDQLIQIENVIGSDGADILFGAAGANVIYGGRGDDAIGGNEGADVLYGGEGVDTVTYERSAGAVWAHLGTGQGFWNDAEGDVLSGFENLSGSRWADLLYGSDGDNIIRGDWGNDNIGGGLGDDMLYGGIGADMLDGGLGADLIDGGTDSSPPAGVPASVEADTLDFTYQFGGVSVSLLWGAGYWNAAEGDRYVNIENVKGTAFNDFIEGDGKANVLTGSGGDDLFTVRPGFGKDVITDFFGDGAGSGDRIQFTGGLFSGFGDLMSHVSQVGDDVVVTVDAANYLALNNVPLGALDPSDFIFL